MQGLKTTYPRLVSRLTLLFFLPALAGALLLAFAWLLATNQWRFSNIVLVYSAAAIGLTLLGAVYVGYTQLRRIRVPTSQDPAQFRAMMAAMAEGIIAVNDHDQILFCNSAATKFFQVTKPTLDVALAKIDGFDKLGEIVQKARQSRTPIKQEIVNRQGEHAVTFEVHATAFAGEATTGVMVVMHDVTELRRLERVRSDFVANVSHELKTPLTSIKGYVETLLSGAMEDQEYNRRFLQKIDDNVIRLTALVQDLLSLARIEAHEGHVALAPVDWLPIVRSVLSRHELNITRKGLTSTVEIPLEPVMVMGDREAMTQILDNLIDNAVKYTPQYGRIAVRLSKDIDKSILSVEDTGLGIPENEVERVFERFYRVDKARSRQVQGTGLGLSIVKHLVSALQGQIVVKSQVGQGTQFVVSMELAS